MNYPGYLQFKQDEGGYIVDIVHDKPVTKGFEMNSFHPQLMVFQVTEVLESRKPGKYKKNNHPDNVMWYRVKAVTKP